MDKKHNSNKNIIYYKNQLYNFIQDEKAFEISIQQRRHVCE